MRFLLLVIASPSLGDDIDASSWAYDMLDAYLASLPRGAHVLTSGQRRGPEAWVRQRAEARGLSWVEYRADGRRVTGRGATGAWLREGAIGEHEQAAALVQAAAQAAARGWGVRVLALRAEPDVACLPDLVASLASAASLPVDQHLCHLNSRAR